MRKLLESAVLIFLFCTLGITQSQLEGTITEEATGELVLFASVVLYADSAEVARTNTDFDGKYYFTDLGKGEYELQVSYLGFETQRISEVVLGDTVIEDVSMKEEGAFTCYIIFPWSWTNPSLIDLENTTSGQIVYPNVRYTSAKPFVLFKKRDLSLKGKVRKKDSEEAPPGVQVRLFKKGELIASTTCDSEGFFEFYPIRRGKYDADFVTPGHTTQRTHVDLNRGKSEYLYITIRDRERI